MSAVLTRDITYEIAGFKQLAINGDDMRSARRGRSSFAHSRASVCKPGSGGPSPSPVAYSAAIRRVLAKRRGVRLAFVAASLLQRALSELLDRRLSASPCASASHPRPTS
jgi:hypothetical protein